MVSRAIVVAAGLGAAASGGRVERVEHRESEMVAIPAGSFFMGFPHGDAEPSEIRLACTIELGDGSDETYCTSENLIDPALPGREVFLFDYEIDRLETTVAEYRACARAGGCSVAPLVFGDPVYVSEPELPMVYVTWQEAADYCAWRGKRLPTEAEWEKAARATDARRWPWGDFVRDDGANHGAVEKDVLRGRLWGAAHFTGDDGDGHATAAPPGALRWSDSEYGVYDLAGNVSEWVADAYQHGYEGVSSIAPLVDAARTELGASPLRVYRGGSWAEPRLFGRTYFRLFADAHQRSFDRGVRCAR